jgi:hypothetical protein
MTVISPATERLSVGKRDWLRVHDDCEWLIDCRRGSMILPNLMLTNQYVQEDPPAGEPVDLFPMGVLRVC